MRIIESAEEIRSADPKRLTLTIGNFDGVHLGHRAVLSELAASAASREGAPVAVTFDPHPVAVIKPDSAPELLTTLDEKIALMDAAGVAAVFVVDFTADLAATGASDFLSWLGVGRGSHMVLGYDFHMGRDRSCDVGRLSELGASVGYGLDVVPPVEYRGKAISSSRIRERLCAGDVQAARDMLGRAYSLSGRVVAGDGVGRGLGSPTANLTLPRGKLLPADGVYYGTLPALGGRAGLLYVGTRPTLGGGARRAEVHVPDLDADLMGDELEIAIEKRLREDRRFADSAELREQIRRDIEEARAAARDADGRDRPS